MSALPIASARQVRSHARQLALRHPRALAVTVALHGLAAASGLAAPWLLGDLVADVGRGAGDVDRVALAVGVFVVVQAAFVQCAMRASSRLGEQVLADLREEFIRNVVALPLGTVEQAGSGDLITRASRDVDILSRTVRQAVPDVTIAAARIVFAVGAVVLVGPLLALSCLVGVPLFVLAARWYVPRARNAFLQTSATYSQLTEDFAETVRGARTVEALRLAERRLDRIDRDIAASDAAERDTLRLMTVFLPISDTTHLLSVAATLLVGGLLYIGDHASLAAVTAAVLYAQQLQDPADTLLYWLGELQLGSVSVARLLGVEAGAAPEASDRPLAVPGSQKLVVRDVSYAYRAGQDVLRHVDLVVEPGERLAIVGPSGAGKSTLGRLLAGIHEPTAGSIALGGAPLARLPLEQRRRHVALVTQEHHVFRGSLRENLLMAKAGAGEDELHAALAAVDAWEWVRDLGLDAPVGSGGHELAPPQAQQLALARLVLADPHTLILDEATSLLSPSAARHMERSLAAVLADRTVIAIAHRLHTAHDADRVVVMERGRIVEVGSHDRLVERGGAYAALWQSWHADAVAVRPSEGSSPEAAI